MAFFARTSLASTIIGTLFFFLALSSTSAAPSVPYGSEVQNIDMELPKAFRQNEQPVYTGVFILCEQYRRNGPIAKVFTHTGQNARYYVDSNCTNQLIRGAANGVRETNHARLLNFPGLYDYFELGAACTADQQVNVRDSEAEDGTVFSCDPGSAATYVLFGTEVLA